MDDFKDVVSYPNDGTVPEDTIEFRSGPGNKLILALSPYGFHYKDQVIEDAGEARRAFIETMDLMRFNLRMEHKQLPELQELLIKFFLASDCVTADATVCNRIHELLRTEGHK